MLKIIGCKNCGKSLIHLGTTEAMKALPKAQAVAIPRDTSRLNHAVLIVTKTKNDANLELSIAGGNTVTMNADDLLKLIARASQAI